MFNDHSLFLMVFTGVVFFFVGFYFGYSWCEVYFAKRREAEEQELEKQRMWNDYLNALRGGKNER